MALIPIKTASITGYCDCICGCYELASQRDDENGKGYCPRCAKEHLEINHGIGIPQLTPSKREESKGPDLKIGIPKTADPPGRLR